jgi:amidase
MMPHMDPQATGATYISRIDEGPEDGVRVAVKDVFDVAGTITTNGCRAVADHAEPADADASCLAGFRDGGARLVAKGNMHELGFGTTGLNPWYGDPVNPCDPHLIPGGSSSGPAVAVAGGDVRLGLGSDTGGSVRVPAACCGIAGLKTTWGRIPATGVAALAPSMDTVGVLARSIADLTIGMQLLDPSFVADARDGAVVVGRVRVAADAFIDDAIDHALTVAGFTVVDVDPLAWRTADEAGRVRLLGEAHHVLGWLARERPEGLTEQTLRRLRSAAMITDADRSLAENDRSQWNGQLDDYFGRFDLLALPTLVEPPPPVTNAGRINAILTTRACNLAGVPALAMPIPGDQPAPVSLQLVAPWGGEATLLAAGARLEDAVTT